jgi:hypothetical protein
LKLTGGWEERQGTKHQGSLPAEMLACRQRRADGGSNKHSRVVILRNLPLAHEWCWRLGDQS